MEFGEKIKHIRVQSLLSQEAFAKELGVSYSTVNRWEKDKTKPNYRALKSIDAFTKFWAFRSIFPSMHWRGIYYELYTYRLL